MSRKSKSKNSNGSSIDALVVETPQKVTAPILRAIREALNDFNVQLEKVELAKQEVRFELSGTPIKAIARERYSVFPLLELEKELFWLGASLTFQRELGNYRLKSVSLIIFKGDAIDERKTALLRAEWDNPDSGSIHAQPHWHVYPRTILMESENFPEKLEMDDCDLSEGNENDEAPSPVTLWKTAANFHYAMASEWQVHSAPFHQHKLNELISITKWVKSCIAYTRDQLSWLYT